ncbi:carbohydrate sulfotransferase 11-like [Mytilus californianus]|uniref:carbohydrate sulfotransferase 11-like n=1 Tax=Mytilus californianus TaxID=6549 RepID=UPI002246E8D1|nr:carbohydrate sulfotransferase 11-like [Mytilus californianus]
MYTKKNLFVFLGSLVLICSTFMHLTTRTYREMSENSSLSRRQEVKEVFKIRRKYQQRYNSTLDFGKFKAAIRKRFDNVQRKCEKFERKQRSVHVLPKHILGRIIVSDKYRFLMCLIPKVSSTTWRRIFLQLSGKFTDKRIQKLTNHAIFYKMYNHYKTLHHYNKKEIDFRIKNYTKVIFVRNPFERILSAYRSKFVNSNQFHKKYGTKIISKYRHNATKREKKRGANVTFLEFLKYITMTKNNHNFHWATYWSVCAPCAINYDYIGMFENLTMESADFLQYVGAKGVKFPRRDLFYSKSKTTKVTQKYYSHIPPKHLAAIRRIYKKDFTLFAFHNSDINNLTSKYA